MVARWFLLLLFALFSRFAASELYTALADLEELLHTEAVLISSLQEYVYNQEQKLDLLKRYVTLYQKQHSEASEDTQKYVSNPINAYLLVKRLTIDWKEVESLINVDLNKEFVSNMTSKRDSLKFPSDEDLNGAAVALMRLQDTYHLDTASLARGELNGIRSSSELSADDCFELGRQSYNNGDYYHTLLWMREADARLGVEMNETVKRSDILEYLAFSTYKQGNVPLALDLTNKLLDIYPSHPRAAGNVVYYKKEIEKAHNFKKKGDDESTDMITDINYSLEDETKGKALYEQLCRGDVVLPADVISDLKCFYTNNSNPFLFIAPFKVEEAHKEPNILIYHDIITDTEIETLKKLSQPRFKRATVQNSVTGELEVAQYRISKSAWLKDHEHKHIMDVCQRVEDMTGLTMETAEELQVVNYGIGGHYEPHYDFARKQETNAFKSLGTGNRIATVLFYMSDVPQGGATVFSYINVALWPKKGAAAFWYNLHSNGEGDRRTRHAACPVLAGSKWVANKWIHERGQEFRRLCDLTPPPSDATA